MSQSPLTVPIVERSTSISFNYDSPSTSTIAGLRITRSPSLRSPSGSPNPAGAVQMRAPNVHFYICDHGNAKVKMLADEFISLLKENGINVYCERFTKHIAGYIVRAQHLTSAGDFFFQIYSKTSSTGNVRLYLNDEMKKLTPKSAVVTVKTLWRLKCGCLSQSEIETLTDEKILDLLVTYSSLTPKELDIKNIIHRARETIEFQNPAFDLAEEIENTRLSFSKGIDQIKVHPIITEPIVTSQGQDLQRLEKPPTVLGLTLLLRNTLIYILNQAIAKLDSISNLLSQLNNVHPPSLENDSHVSWQTQPTSQNSNMWNYIVDDDQDYVTGRGLSDDEHMSNPLSLTTIEMFRDF